MEELGGYQVAEVGAAAWIIFDCDTQLGGIDNPFANASNEQFKKAARLVKSWIEWMFTLRRANKRQMSL